MNNLVWVKGVVGFPERVVLGYSWPIDAPRWAEGLDGEAHRVGRTVAVDLAVLVVDVDLLHLSQELLLLDL